MPRLLIIWSELRGELHVFVPNENRVAGYESGLEIYEARLVLICFCVGAVPSSPNSSSFLFVPSDNGECG